MARDVNDRQIAEVFDAWRTRQPTRRATLTEQRAALIRARLAGGHEVADLVALIRYAYEADTDEARFWRGANDRDRSYLGLDNLLRARKLADRVDRAHEWAARHDLGEIAGTDDDDLDGVIASPIALLRGRA